MVKSCSTAFKCVLGTPYRPKEINLLQVIIIIIITKYPAVII